MTRKIRREEHRAFLRTIGARLDEARKKAGLTVKQLTERTNRELTSKEVAQMHLRRRCFGIVLKVKRQNARLSIEQLASKAGVDAKKIAAWEQGRRLSEVFMTDIYDLSKALDVSCYDLWTEVERVAKLAERMIAEGTKRKA